MPTAVVQAADLTALQALCREIVVSRPQLDFAARLTAASMPGIAAATELVARFAQYGAGVRAAQAMILGAKARALLAGRANVAFEDLRAVALPALRHRIVLNYEGEAAGVSTDEIVNDLLERVSENSKAVDSALGR